MTIKSPGVITIGGLTFNETDGNGVERAFDTLDGWHDGPSVTVEQTDRIVSHGVFSQPGHRGGRTITQSGWIYAPTRALAVAAVDELTALLADGSSDTFTFIDADLGARWVDVQLFATPDIAWDDDPLFCRYQLQFFASESYRFGSTSTSETPFASTPVGAGMVFPLYPGGFMNYGELGVVGSATVTNGGDADASVTFTVTGPTPTGGFVILDPVTDKRITFLGAVPAGSTLVLDGADGSVVINGTADRLGDTIVEAWPVVPAGDSRSFYFQPLGGTTAAVLSVSCVSTYW